MKRNIMESVKQQAFTLINKTNDLILNLTPENVTQHSRIVRVTGVHSFLGRGVHYLLTDIMKNLVLHGKER